jgi:hypothetical protein
MMIGGGREMWWFGVYEKNNGHFKVRYHYLFGAEALHVLLANG